MKMVFDLDMDKCVACGACAVACMDQNDIRPDKGDEPFRVIGSLEEKGVFEYLSLSCMHCTDAPCIPACPVCCLRKDERGITVYDRKLCIGCHSCAMACPYGAPRYDPADGHIRKCDGCTERLKYGYEPACVRVCPTKALVCMTEEEYEKAHIGRSLRKETMGK